MARVCRAWLWRAAVCLLVWEQPLWPDCLRVYIGGILVHRNLRLSYLHGIPYAVLARPELLRACVWMGEGVTTGTLRPCALANAGQTYS